MKKKQNVRKQLIATALTVVQLFCIIFSTMPVKAQQEGAPSIPDKTDVRPQMIVPGDPACPLSTNCRPEDEEPLPPPAVPTVNILSRRGCTGAVLR
jgi:hypothetical protein